MSWNRMPVEERYTHDPVFAALVDLFYAHLEHSNETGRLYTPTELREAVMLAATMWENRHIRPILVDANKDRLRY